MTDLDPCQLITSDDASTFVGVNFGKGKATTTENNVKMCSYSAPGPNIFTVEVAVAPDVATAQAAEAAAKADLASQGAELAVIPLPSFADDTDAAILQGSASSNGISLGARALLLLKGTTFVGFSDISAGGAQPPSEQAFKDEGNARAREAPLTGSPPLAVLAPDRRRDRLERRSLERRPTSTPSSKGRTSSSRGVPFWRSRNGSAPGGTKTNSRPVPSSSGPPLPSADPDSPLIVPLIVAVSVHPLPSSRSAAIVVVAPRGRASPGSSPWSSSQRCGQRVVRALTTPRSGQRSAFSRSQAASSHWRMRNPPTS